MYLGDVMKKAKNIVLLIGIIFNLLYIKYCGIAGVAELKSIDKLTPPHIAAEIIGKTLPALFLRFKTSKITGKIIKAIVIKLGKKSLYMKYLKLSKPN